MSTFISRLPKNLQLTGLYAIISILWSSCIVVEDDAVHYGPTGLDGKAWFGIDYDHEVPYSYWDDNPSMPDQPFYGEYYRTNPGLYHFEYFVNPHEYWYGTYEIYVNSGKPGGPYGQPGEDGSDTYLLLICNDEGFYFEQWEDCTCKSFQLPDGTWIIEGTSRESSFRIEMKKTSTLERPTLQSPKLKNT